MTQRTFPSPGFSAPARRMRALACATSLAAWMTGSGCAKPQATQEPESAETTKPAAVHDYMPLKDRTVSTFEMTTDLGDRGILMLEISRPRPDLAELAIAGRVQRLTVEEHRISQATGGILLEEPLTVGHSFRGSFGTVVIQAIDQLVKLPAGTFTGCLTTVEESTQPPKRATSTYCPGIGLVQMKVESFGSEGPGMVETHLTHHGPRVEIPQRRTESGSRSAE